MRVFIGSLFVFGVLVVVLSSTAPSSLSLIFERSAVLPNWSEVKDLQISYTPDSANPDSANLNSAIHLKLHCGENCPSIAEFRGLKVSKEWTDALAESYSVLRSLPQYPESQAPKSLEQKEKGGKTLKFRFGDGGSLVLRWGEYNPFYKAHYLAVERVDQGKGEKEAHYVLAPEELLGSVFRDPQDLLDKRMFPSITRSQVEQWIVSGASIAPLVFQRAESGWTVNGLEADAPFVEGYLRDFLNLRFQNFEDLEDGSLLPNPLLSLSLVSKSRSFDTETDAINIYRESGHLYFVRDGLRYRFSLAEARFLHKLPRQEQFLSLGS